MHWSRRRAAHSLPWQDAARAANRLFPLSLGSEGSCQIGGNLATNAGGTAVLRYGMMRELAFGLEAVLADGSVMSQLAPLAKDNTGYNLANLLIGSEGTLGVITAACLKLFPLPRATATAWVAIPSPAAALELLARLRAASDDRLSTLELVPHVALALVLKHMGSVRDPEVATSPWYLLVELTSSSNRDLDALLTSVSRKPNDAGLVTDAALASNDAQRENLWRLRESIPEAQRKAGGSLKHDISVPGGKSSALHRSWCRVGRYAGTTGFPRRLWPRGDGNLHFNINQCEGADRTEFARGEAPLKRAIHDLVAQFGGSFSAEHGIGKLKVDELRRYAQPAELAAMHRIKQALDPHGILNAGKVL